MHQAKVKTVRSGFNFNCGFIDIQLIVAYIAILGGFLIIIFQTVGCANLQVISIQRYRHWKDFDEDDFTQF